MAEEEHTILVVDDEPINLRMVERLLKRKFRVLTATSGKEALEMLAREDVALLISDQVMPGMTGTDLLSQARQTHPSMVGVLLTSASDNETFRAAIMDSGALRVIIKPWDPDKLMRVAESAIERYKGLLQTRQTLDQLKEMQASLKRLSRT